MPTRTSSRTPSTRRTTPRWSPPSRLPAWSRRCQGAGPFTVFAPTNEAFDALPAGTVDTLLKPENKDELTKILTCHVVGAKAMSADIMKMVKDDGGAHEVKTVGGCELTAQG